jgi:predicted small lipoprotein YifL
MPQRLLPSLIGLTLAVALTGCGENGPPAGPPLAAAHPVHGRITFSDQTPLKGGVIYFAPTEIDADGRVRYEAAGLVDANGKYSLGFNGDHSGAPAGECKVFIQPRDYQELPNSNSKRIPARYRDKSKTPLVVSVKEGGNTFNFEIK